MKKEKLSFKTYIITSVFITIITVFQAYILEHYFSTDTPFTLIIGSLLGSLLACSSFLILYKKTGGKYKDVSDKSKQLNKLYAGGMLALFIGLMLGMPEIIWHITFPMFYTALMINVFLFFYCVDYNS